MNKDRRILDALPNKFQQPKITLKSYLMSYECFLHIQSTYLQTKIYDYLSSKYS